MDKYKVIKSRLVTEKASVLGNLQHSESNKCSLRCKTPKYVFIVDPRATKPEIASAVEGVYADRKVKVTSVNTMIVKPKRKRVRGKFKYGIKSGYKKAIVSLSSGDALDEAI